MPCCPRGAHALSKILTKTFSQPIRFNEHERLVVVLQNYLVVQVLLKKPWRTCEIKSFTISSSPLSFSFFHYATLKNLFLEKSAWFILFILLYLFILWRILLNITRLEWLIKLLSFLSYWDGHRTHHQIIINTFLGIKVNISSLWKVCICKYFNL